METTLTPTTPRLVSLQVGMPRKLDFHGKEWESAIFKAPVSARVCLESTNLDGDRQYNLKFHGGLDKAVCCYASEHYSYWQNDFCMGDIFTYGAFGENFTVSGLPETEACIGDVWAVGTARVQVCQPRMPCINVARKWDRKDMPTRMEELGYTGYYLRVMQTGDVGAGDEITLLERPNPGVTIHVINRAWYQHEGTPEQNARIANLPELASSAKRIFQRLNK
jgi:MOSC domain-containing protein YiiM